MAIGDLATVSAAKATGSAAGDSSVSAPLQTISTASAVGSAGGSATALGQCGTISLQAQSGASFGTAAAIADLSTVVIVSQGGSAKAFNPPGKAIAWTHRITHAGPNGRAIAWDGPQAKATARVVRTRSAAKYLQPVG